MVDNLEVAGDAGRRLAQRFVNKDIDLLYPKAITPIRCGACKHSDSDQPCPKCGHKP